ncbi:hypothetical protein [Streptomyces sp. NPDC058694]|uniref:hypothetical protein n=1 Tax=Streptomyces sp. NPDC058694 TaxID=3346603 RepID=UPI00364661E3
MGMKDQFQDKADQLNEQARERAGQGRDEERERGQQPRVPREPREPRERERQEPGRRTPDEAQRASRDAERFDQDYDI